MVATTRPSTRFARRPGETGASAVEFAFVVPVLVCLLFGIVTCGLALFHSVSLNDSVRAGARFGATAVSDGNWTAAVRARTVEYYAGASDELTTADVCVQLVKGPSATQVQSACALTGSAATPPPSPAGLTATDCVVKVWAAQPATLSAPPFYSKEILLKRGSVTRYERTC